MEHSGFIFKGNLFKGNLHSHTTNSDGKLTPLQAVSKYAKNGYSFLAITDHDLYTDYRNDVNSEQFIVLPGIEISAILADAESKKAIKVHHVNAILGTAQMQLNATKPLLTHMQRLEPEIILNSWQGLQTAQKILDDVSARGMLATYNHPIWSRVEVEEFAYLDNIWAFEVFNYGTELESATGYGDVHWEMMLRKGKHANAFASDDNHNNPELDDMFGGYIVVSAPELTHDAVVSELIAGNYYSSSGVEINKWYVTSGKAIVECCNVHNITFFCGNHINDGRTIFAEDNSNGLCYAEYELKGHEPYIRVVCTDLMGRKAWSNPIWL